MDSDIIIHITIQHWEFIGLYWVACSWIVHESLRRGESPIEGWEWMQVIFSGYLIPFVCASCIILLLFYVGRAIVSTIRKWGI